MKKILKILLIVLLAIIVVAGGYVAYVFISYDRIDDMQPIGTDVPEKAVDAPVSADKLFTAVTQNVGFGAYTRDFTFFMDGGKESRAKSEESVVDCTNKAADAVNEYDPDFIFFQEVDFDSTRSYHVDQRKIFEEKFNDRFGAFAVNYHSAYLMYPIFEPHGASNSGLLTLSKGKITDSLRRKLPISESFSKILDLDRCYVISRVPLDNGKELVVINVHLSAYGGSEEIHEQQMKMLFSDMAAEYEKGNYCICGGDFNHDFTGDSVIKLNGEGTEREGWTQPFPTQYLPEHVCRALDYSGGKLIPTCRNCDIPYEEGNFTVIVDGFLITDNIEVEYLENIQKGFEYSDHNPVVIKFRLK